MRFLEVFKARPQNLLTAQNCLPCVPVKSEKIKKLNLLWELPLNSYKIRAQLGKPVKQVKIPFHCQNGIAKDNITTMEGTQMAHKKCNNQTKDDP